jgi:hypothetical protein
MDRVKLGLILLFIIGVGLFSAFVWPTRYRYEALKTADETITIRVDRFSDKTWMLLPGGWIPQGGKEKPQPTAHDQWCRRKMFARTAPRG